MGYRFESCRGCQSGCSITGPYNQTKVRLVREKFELNAPKPNYVNITSASDGTLSKINPLVKPDRNSSLKFDLSDSSLSFVNNGISYSAFDFDLYSDKNFTTNYLTSGASSSFEVTKSGQIGIDTTANLTLSVSDYVPTNLYYKFTPVNLDIIISSKSEISIDETVSNYNEIEAVSTEYDGAYVVSGVGTTTFSYNVPRKPKVSSYNSRSSNIVYETTSRTAFGAIAQLKIYDGGHDYRSLPGITSVISGIGSGAILEPGSTNIGNILNTKFNNIGFDYPSDQTVRASANLPEILKINPLSSFERIGISSAGQNYLVAPDLVVIDGYTNE